MKDIYKNELMYYKMNSKGYIKKINSIINDDKRKLSVDIIEQLQIFRSELEWCINIINSVIYNENKYDINIDNYLNSMKLLFTDLKNVLNLIR